MLGLVVSSHQSAGRAISVADAAVVLLRRAPQLMIAAYNLESHTEKPQQQHKTHSKMAPFKQRFASFHIQIYCLHFKAGMKRVF